MKHFLVQLKVLLSTNADQANKFQSQQCSVHITFLASRSSYLIVQQESLTNSNIPSFVLLN